MTLAATKKEYQGYVLDGMARTLWLHAYADWAEHNAVCAYCGEKIRRDEGEAYYVSEDGREQCDESGDGTHFPDDNGVPVPDAGGGWDDIAPVTPDAAYLAAHDLGKLLARSEGMEKEKSPLADLFELAIEIDRADEEGFEFTWTPDESNYGDRPTLADNATEFGGALANMALGHGVSWFDDHKQRFQDDQHRTRELSLAVPSFECRYDGDELTWSGKEGQKGAGAEIRHGTQQARHEEGEAVPAVDKIGKITVVNPNDRTLGRHRYVFAFGAYGDTLLLAYASGEDSALDECIDWLVEHAPGHIIDDQVEEEFKRQKAEGKSDEDAWQEAEIDTISGGNAGNHVNASEVHVLAVDPTRDQLFEIAQVAQNPAAANPANLTPKGEQMYEEIRRGYAAVGNQRAREIAARTVSARAKGGARGLVAAKNTRKRGLRPKPRRRHAR